LFSGLTGQERLAQRRLERLRGHLARRRQRLADRQHHLGVVGDQGRIAGQLLRPARTVPGDDQRVLLKLGRRAERVTVRQSEE
jgi:hypothetical protein